MTDLIIQQLGSGDHQGRRVPFPRAGEQPQARAAPQAPGHGLQVPQGAAGNYYIYMLCLFLAWTF